MVFERQLCRCRYGCYADALRASEAKKNQPEGALTRRLLVAT